MKSSVTVSLVEEARGGPFVFWDDLRLACSTAAHLGFDAIEIFAPSPVFLDLDQTKSLLSEFNLSVAAVGTGAGMIKHGLSLTDADSSIRQKARDFVAAMIQFGGSLGAPAIIGSMQGRWTTTVDRTQALNYLSEALRELGSLAHEHSQSLFYEPLNRYETNLIRTLSDGCEFLLQVGKPNVLLLADLFHMNIEEAKLDRAILEAGGHIGHVHFVDSNRRAAGMGHLDFAPIVGALKAIKFAGFLSAEAFALPDSNSAAAATIETLRRFGAADSAS